MMKILSAIVLCLFAVVGFAETPLTVAISPQGAAIQTSATIQLSVACTYAVHGADDCTAAGGAVWSTSATSTSVISVSSSGLVTAVSDGGAGSIPGYFVVAKVGSIHDVIQVDIQHAGDTWYQYITPDYHFYKSLSIGNALLPMNVVVGSIVTIGTGVLANNTGAATGTPFQGVCNWVSSDNTLATVNREGLVTAIAPGAVTITCNVPGGWNWGTSSVTGWQTPGNYINLTIVAGGTGTNTWYVRPAGGSPWYDGTSTPYGQCDGLHDADYVGGPTALWQLGHAYNLGDQVAASNGQIMQITTAGTSNTTQHPTWPSSGTVTDGTAVWTAEGTYPVDQACALGNLRYFWTDLTSYEQIFWTSNFHGGDTIIVRQNANGYTMGLDNPGTFGGPSNCYGVTDGCRMPTIPSGTAAQHTRILGENYASCVSNSAKTLLSGTWGTYGLFNTLDSQYVDVACFEMTDRAMCGGNTNYLNVCSGKDNGVYGVMQSALTSNVNYTDLYIHGLSSEGIYGASGVGIVANRVFLSGLPIGGVDMDDHPWGSGNMSVSGGFTMNNSVTQFVGCVEEYPVVHTYPYIECRDQTTGSYADGFGTASATGDWIFNNDIWRYNFQDGLDLLHSGMNSLKVTQSQSYGNDGQQWKVGSGKLVTFQTNLTLHNCQRVGTLFGDEPNTANVPNATNAVSHSTTSLVVTYTNGLVVTAAGVTTATPTTGGSVTLAPNSVSYTWIDPTTFTLQMNTTGFPGGLPNQFRLAVITTNGIGVPSGTGYYVTENAQYTLCRAAGDGIAVAFDGLGADLFQSNTFVGYGATSYDILCTGGWQTCSAANTVFENNVNLAISNTTYNSGVLPGLFFFQEDSQWSTIDHNLYYNFKAGCPTLHTGDLCSDPLFTSEPPLTISNETTLDNFNFNITSGSPAVHTGVNIPGLTTDAVGYPYANPPSMGGLEFEGVAPPTALYSGSISFSGGVQF